MKRQTTVVATLLLGLSACSSGSSHATTPRVAPADASGVALSAAATSDAEVPPSLAPPSAQGAFVGHINGHVLGWRITFSNLSGPVTGAHVHVGKGGVAGPMLIPLCEPCTDGQQGSIDITAAQAQVLLGADTYVNIHTARNPNGEVRGQISVSR